MKTLTYTITFLDYWHLSSGLSAGTKLDSSVVKDAQGLPYAPGKTLKGLFREMAAHIDTGFESLCFGDKGNQQGACYFSNAILQTQEAQEIVDHQLQNHLYEVIASTKIGANGIAEDKTLREIEVVIPVTLHGTIENIPQEHAHNMKKAIEMVKRMGLNRSRGLGRCCIQGALS